jgi:hypothetical protein
LASLLKCESLPGLHGERPADQSCFDWAPKLTIRPFASPENAPQSKEERPGAGARAVGSPRKLIIIDWDDTVFPTSYLIQMGITHYTQPHEIPPVLRDALRKYALRVKGTFEILEAHGQVAIVTNAKRGWIETSCAHFLPEIEPLVRSFRRISAQPLELDELEDPKPHEWKEEAFVAIAKAHYKDPALRPVFSLGDALYEREALLRTSDRLGVVPQSVKLLDHPSLETLEAEHASLQDDGYLQELLSRLDGFDLYFDVLDGPRPWEERADTPKSQMSAASTNSAGTTSTTASATSQCALPPTPLSIHGRSCLKL